MQFCKVDVEDDVFFLTLDSDDGGHNYLTLQFMEDLRQKLVEIRGKVGVKSRGLVTVCAGGSFCEGVEYEQSSSSEVDELAHLMAEVVRLLFDMPFPTVAAVTGDVRTSLALALVLAHDYVAALKQASFEVPEVRDGRGDVPPYVTALLRDKAPYPLMMSKLVLQAEAMDGSTMKYWYAADTIDDPKEAVDYINKVGDGEAYVTTRKSFFPESWKSVSEFLRDDHQ
ncbi:hypothetical protein ACP70R_004081 [Stipagrostis hirtigluma subsp. patula]